MTKYTEIFKLKEMLEEAHIKFTFHDDSLYNDINPFDDVIMEKYQIACPSRHSKNHYLSVIQGFGTYGEGRNLLEIMGLNEPWEKGPVVGGLTAEEVYKRIEKYWITSWKFKNKKEDKK